MKAAAYVVGPRDGSGAALMTLAHSLGFEVVLPYAGVAAAERQALETPICFFLFAAVPQVTALQSTAEAIRFCRSRRVRFSPMIYLAETPSIEAITCCINMGFDDVVSLPSTRPRLLQRLHRQVGEPTTFYETAGYFGPDRRQRITAPRRPGEERLGGQFRRLEIVRNLLSGITVLQDGNYLQDAASVQ